MSLADELLKLEQLRTSGTLSEQEFQQAKRRLLNPASSTPPYRPSPPAEDQSLGRAANRYVSLQVASTVIGAILFLIILFCVILPNFGGGSGPGDLCQGFHC